MGKGQSPTPDELKFIYRLIEKGYSDTDILSKYTRGRPDNIPYREDVRFIRQRRKEFDSAREVLGESLKQEVNTSIERAREEHHKEIHSMIEKWLDAIPAFPPFLYEWKCGLAPGIFNNIPRKLHSTSKIRSFNIVKEHLPIKSLWEEYSDWETNFAEYIETCRKVLRLIKEQHTKAEYWPNICELDEGFDEIIVDKISHNQSISNWEQQLVFDTHEKHLLASIEILKGMWQDQPCIILTADNPSNYITSYQELITNVLNDDEVNKLYKVTSKLITQQRYIKQTVEDILIRRDYIMHTCSLCPGQDKGKNLNKKFL